MKDEEFEGLMRDAARTYRRPPELADADATWRAIEGALPAARAAEAPDAVAVPPARRGTGPWARAWRHPLARMAAMLLVGVAVGRASVQRTTPATPDVVGTTTAPTAAVAVADSVVPAVERAATDAYLARTAVLLAGLPDELRARKGDAVFRTQADALLLQTRLLLDSPAAADPGLRALLEDLEVVLAQVVRLDARRDPVEVEFLHEALEQRDVIPRLREAVGDYETD